MTLIKYNYIINVCLVKYFRTSYSLALTSFCSNYVHHRISSISCPIFSLNYSVVLSADIVYFYFLSTGRSSFAGEGVSVTKRHVAFYHSIYFSIVTVTTINYKLFSIRYNIENCSLHHWNCRTFMMKMLQLRCYDN